MTSPFQTLFSGSPATGLMARFGETVKYTPSGVAQKTITGIVGDINAQEVIEEDGRGLLHVAEVTLWANDTTGVASPSLDDTMEFGGFTNWRVRDWDNCGTTVTVQVARFDLQRVEPRDFSQVRAIPAMR